MSVDRDPGARHDPRTQRWSAVRPAAAARTSFPEALRAAISRRDLPLERISAHLQARGHAVSIGTLSYWQSGRSSPTRASSLRALGALEIILEVDRGHLAQLVPTPPPTDEPEPALALADLDTQMAFLDEIVREMGRGVDDTTRITCAHWRSFNDEHGSVRYGRIREVLQATQTTDAFVTSAWHPVAGQDVVITPLLGCRVRRQVARAEHSVCVAELAIPVLLRGCTHAVEYEISYPTASEHVQFNRAVCLLPSPVAEMVIEVNFPARALPRDVHLIEGDGGDEPLRRTPLPRVHPTMTLARHGFGPGLLGFEWQPPTPVMSPRAE